VLDQEGNQVTGELQYGDIGIEVQAVDTFTLENNMLVEYSIDVRHWYLLESMVINQSIKEDTMPDLLGEEPGWCGWVK
jgi:hypothetical protein